MPVNRYPMYANFGLLPEPEGRLASFITSGIINFLILVLVLIIGMTAKRAVEQHRYEQMVLIVPSAPPPPAREKVAPAPKLREQPKPLVVKLEQPRIHVAKPEPRPDLKPIQMEAKVRVPVLQAPVRSVILAPQPKAALSAAMPAQTPQARPSTAQVHFGQTFGVTPNPNATRPATIAAIGNPYGGMRGAAIAPHGVVGSAGIGNGIRSGSNSGIVGKVASAGIPGSSGTAPAYMSGKVASAGIPSVAAAASAAPRMVASPAFTNLEVLSKPPVQYTSEAKQYKVQGDVVLRVTFTAAGQVVVQNVLHGLGHGLDEEARRVAQQIRFRPATRNGQAVDMTTNIVITFQLA